MMPPVIKPSEDINVPGKTIEVTIDGQGMPVHYTTDGSDPDEDSPLYSGPLEIRENTVLKARAFGSDGTVSMVSEGRYHFVSPVAATKPVKPPEPGLRYRYYEHQWTLMPDFSDFTPVDSGISPKAELGMQKSEDHFGIVFDGYIKLPVDGLYTFYLNSDDGSILYIDGIKVVDNDRSHGAREVSGRYPFQAGYHPVRLEYFDNELYQELTFFYSAPGIEKQEVGKEMLFH